MNPSNGSGDLFPAFSTANLNAANPDQAIPSVETTPNDSMDPIFAGVVQTPRDLNGADVYDCFSVTEVVVYEILGLAKSGATALPQMRNEKMKANSLPRRLASRRNG